MITICKCKCNQNWMNMENIRCVEKSATLNHSQSHRVSWVRCLYYNINRTLCNTRRFPDFERLLSVVYTGHCHWQVAEFLSLVLKLLITLPSRYHFHGQLHRYFKYKKPFNKFTIMRYIPHYSLRHYSIFKWPKTLHDVVKLIGSFPSQISASMNN